jgi:hypothetical protein
VSRAWPQENGELPTTLATVADIARALRMSPANVYRFFDMTGLLRLSIGSSAVRRCACALPQRIHFGLNGSATVASASLPFGVLAVPSLGAGMERHIHGRGVALASHLPDAPLGAPFPRDLRRTRGNGAADVIGSLLRE